MRARLGGSREQPAPFGTVGVRRYPPARALQRLPLALLVLVLAAPAGAQPLPDALAAQLVEEPLGPGGSTFRYSPGDPTAAAVRPMLDAARDTIEAFFGAPFPEPVRVVILPSRATFDAVLGAAWGVPETACWMVAAGVADFAVILSPGRWADEACEHDGTDPQHVQDIVTHELTHTYHGQHNPTRDFTGADEIGWFVEGLAVLVAGQLNWGRLSDAAEAVARGLAPTRLADAWSGRYRYGVSGSLVQYLDAAYGRAMLVRLLGATTQAELLDALGVTEDELLARWQEWVQARG